MQNNASLNKLDLLLTEECSKAQRVLSDVQLCGISQSQLSHIEYLCEKINEKIADAKREAEENGLY